MTDLVERQAVLDLVHKSIREFFDPATQEEEPLSDKDKLLLSVNKDICIMVRALPSVPADSFSQSEINKCLDALEGVTE